jgi:small-conductance mechanosensitive channel
MDAGPIIGVISPFLPNLLAILFLLAAAKLLLGSTGKILQLLYKHFNIPRGYYLKVRALVRALIIVFTFFMIMLFIPGVDQKVIALVGVGIGLLVSLSSTTTIGNAVAGGILYMTRPLSEGDRVKIDGVMGDVVSLELLFVHLKTIKDEIVSIPALKVLNSMIINYSRLDKVIVHVSLTLGYDLDPGLVEDLMLKAVAETEGIIPDPKPFLLIRALDDFTVEYEANGYTDNPQMLVVLESRIRRNMILEFTRAKVQIMSPCYYNITQLPAQEKVLPECLTHFEAGEVADKEDEKKKMVEAKRKLEEKKRQEIKLEGK